MKAPKERIEELKEVVALRAERDGRPREVATLLKSILENGRLLDRERDMCRYCEESSGEKLSKAEAVIKECIALLTVH